MTYDGRKRKTLCLYLNRMFSDVIAFTECNDVTDAKTEFTALA